MSLALSCPFLPFSTETINCWPHLAVTAMQFPAVPGAGLLSLYSLCLRIFCLLFKLYFKACSQASLNVYCGRNTGIYGCYTEFLQKLTPQGVEGRREDERCGEELCSSDLEMCWRTYMHYHRLFTGQELLWPHLWGKISVSSQCWNRDVQ